MKLHFEHNLDYQLQANEAVCDLGFRVFKLDSPTSRSGSRSAKT